MGCQKWSLLGSSRHSPSTHKFNVICMCWMLIIFDDGTSTRCSFSSNDGMVVILCYLP